MAIDHSGAIFFPQMVWLRVIGRLTFPIFAWMIAMGYVYTKNVYLYAFRLFLVWIVSQIPYFFLFESLNIMPTLLAGLLCIYVYDRVKNKMISVPIILLAVYAAQFFAFDYGAYGVLMIFSFYLFKNHFELSALVQVLLVSAYTGYVYVLYHSLSIYTFIQIFSLFALPLIYWYNGKQGLKAKYLFYAFYPLHLLVLLIIKLLLPA